MAKLDKFSQKYGFFLSDASNEEIISISKELSEEMSSQTKSLNTVALSLMGISTFALMFSLFLIAQTDIPSSSWKTIIYFLRIAAVVFMCLSILTAFFGITRALGASSLSPLMWRNIRETASDEKVYEQMAAVNKLNVMIYKGKNNARVASIFIVIGGICLSLAFVLSMLVSSGYI